MYNKNNDFLYKYFPLRKDRDDDLGYIKKVLENNVLYFSCLKSFNDPFDCCPVYVQPTSKDRQLLLQRKHSEGYSEADVEKAKNIYDRNKKINLEGFELRMSQNIHEEIGICCFSKKPDNLLMWAHYASCHAGVCFEFKRCIEYPFFLEAQQVHYRLGRPKVNPLRRNVDGRVDNKTINDIFFSKSSDWKYESEYRIVNQKRSPGEEHKFPSQCLSGIIFGAKMEKEHGEVLKEIAIKRKLTIKKAVLDKAKYQIGLKNI